MYSLCCSRFSLERYLGLVDMSTWVSVIPGPGTRGSSQYLLSYKKPVAGWSFFDWYQSREQQPQGCVGSQPWTLQHPWMSKHPAQSTTWKQPLLLLEGQGSPYLHCLPLSIASSWSASHPGLCSALLTNCLSFFWHYDSTLPSVSPFFLMPRSFLCTHFFLTVLVACEPGKGPSQDIRLRIWHYLWYTRGLDNWSDTVIFKRNKNDYANVLLHSIILL